MERRGKHKHKQEVQEKETQYRANIHKVWMQEKSFMLGLHISTYQLHKTNSFPLPYKNKQNKSRWPAFRIQSTACEAAREINELQESSTGFFETKISVPII